MRPTKIVVHRIKNSLARASGVIKTDDLLFALVMVIGEYRTIDAPFTEKVFGAILRLYFMTLYDKSKLGLRHKVLELERSNLQWLIVYFNTSPVLVAPHSQSCEIGYYLHGDKSVRNGRQPSV